ncbi:MAG: exodeoxyribonuclease V subunit alpha [Ottowia sp.]|nr:exodeoxyribonuclease V subunit alpha [Ottowia sp.]
MTQTDTSPPPLDILAQLSEQGTLRRLDYALAAFLCRREPAAPAALPVAAALVSHVEGEGHTCLPLADLPARLPPALAAQSLPATAAQWLAALRGCACVRLEDEADGGQPLVLRAEGADARLYLRRYFQFEQTIRQALAAHTGDDTPAAPEAEQRRWLDRLFAATNGFDWQKAACALALRGRFTLITGGPGTGKTYTTARLLALLAATAARREALRVALAAPTGKAAARLRQSIDSALAPLCETLGGQLDLPAFAQRIGPARTLHSLLGARGESRRFRHHAGNLLDVDVLVIDEASMVHLEMMAAIFQALPAHARLILLGDKDQLASVEAGAVLGELCRDAERGNYPPETARYLAETTGQTLPAEYLAPAGQAPDNPLARHTVMLRHSHRFHGPIGKLAQAVNRGDVTGAQDILHEANKAPQEILRHRAGARAEELHRLAFAGADSYRSYLELLQNAPTTPEAHAQWAADILRAFDRFRILCATHHGAFGVHELNRAIAHSLAEARLIRPTGLWYAGRPVMVTRNSPELGVFNGDTGITLPTPESARLRVYFLNGDELRSVATSRLAHIDTAFALTVHKSQGSEFTHTVLALGRNSGQVLSRELVYTGITRARERFTLMEETPDLFTQAIAQPTRRAGGLMR